MGRRLVETIVGVFIIIGAIIFVVLYLWLAGMVGLRNTYEVTVYFDDVTGLRAGDPVMVFGIEKGRVKAFRIEGTRVVTTLAIENDIRLPSDSKIAVRSVSYLGSDRYVRIDLGKAPTESAVYYGHNETLDIEAFATVFDSLTNMLKGIQVPDLNKAITKIANDIDRNTRQLSEMLKSPSEKIENLVVRLDSLSGQFKKEGTLGRLMQSDELYIEVMETNQELKALIKDIQENPKKYINIKIF